MALLDEQVESLIHMHGLKEVLRTLWTAVANNKANIPTAPINTRDEICAKLQLAEVLADQVESKAAKK